MSDSPDYCTQGSVSALKSGYTCDLVQHCEYFRNTEFIEFTEEDTTLRVASQESSISLLWSLLKCPFIAMRLMSVLWDDRLELQGLKNISKKKISIIIKACLLFFKIASICEEPCHDKYTERQKGSALKWLFDVRASSEERKTKRENEVGLVYEMSVSKRSEKMVCAE